MVRVPINFEPPSDVVLEVSSEAELRHIPYWKQGDPSLHTPLVLRRRADNREHPIVLAALDAYWIAAAALDGIDGEDQAAFRAYEIGRERYVDILTKLGIALFEEFKPKGTAPPADGIEADARYGAEETWKVEAPAAATVGAESLLSRERYYDSLFECAKKPPSHMRAHSTCRARARHKHAVSSMVPQLARCTHSASATAPPVTRHAPAWLHIEHPSLACIMTYTGWLTCGPGQLMRMSTVSSSGDNSNASSPRRGQQVATGGGRQATGATTSHHTEVRRRSSRRSIQSRATHHHGDAKRKLRCRSLQLCVLSRRRHEQMSRARWRHGHPAVRQRGHPTEGHHRPL